jgi:carboxypeptidase Taq
MANTPQPTTAANSIQFTTSDDRISELLGLMREIADLGALNALAGWDQNTALPDGAGEVRGQQLATMQGVLHERLTNPRLGQLLAALEELVQAALFTDADRGLVRESKRAYEHATKLPRGLVEEMARVEAASFESWRRAREQSDFASFAPWLSRTVTLQREVADRYGYKETRYDALLDLYEPDLTAAAVDQLFGPVRDTSIGLLKRVQASGTSIDASLLAGDFPSDKQLALADKVLRAIGYDFSRGGTAVSPHPFTTSFGSPFDVRLTVHPDPRFLQASVMAAIHEGGHALYEQGSAHVLARTPIAGGASLGAHESQSRLWENAIGRSEPFWQGQFHLVREMFPEQFAAVNPAAFTRALNHVAPSLIRIEADEVTYNLHIIIRFELEQQLVNGNLAVESLPGLWNAKYQEYLGVTPKNDAKGVLQDVHWTSGFGYFPTYTLGNLYAAQIYAALRKAFPDFDQRLAVGDTEFILRWLQERMYIVGGIYTPPVLIERVTGEPPNPAYFARYLNDRFEQVYSLT